MSKQTVYVVRKDGLYLLSYQLSEIREFDSTGRLADVYTCIWGESSMGARAFRHMARARAVMNMVDGDAVEEILAEVNGDVED